MKSKKVILGVTVGVSLLIIFVFVWAQTDKTIVSGIGCKKGEDVSIPFSITQNIALNEETKADKNGKEEAVNIEDTEWLRQKRSHVVKDLFGEIDSAKYISEDPELLGAYAEQVFLGICQCPDILDYAHVIIEESGIDLLQENRDLFEGIEWDFAESVLSEDATAGYTVIKEQYVESNPQNSLPIIVIYWRYGLCEDPDMVNWWQKLGSLEVLAVQKDMREEKQILMTEKIPQMSLKEIQAYTEKVFQLLTWDPVKIDNYQEVFDEESIQIWKDIEWCYDTPEKFYDFSASVIWDKKNNTIIGLTGEDYHLVLYDIDWSSVPFRVLPGTFYEEEERKYGVVKWTLEVDWEYNLETGEFTIKKAEIGPNQF